MVISSLGSQGGDLRNLPPGKYIDLSTCVNRYGPPPAARAALQKVSDDELRIHPYGVSSQLEAAYSRKLRVETGELIAGRGTTEFIWSLSRMLNHREVAIPFPAYTDFLKAFPGCGLYLGSSQTQCFPRIEQIEIAMGSHRFVLISNPNNPTGTQLPPEALVRICELHPRSILCVDESYVDFLPDAFRISLAGAGVENLVVLQSPSKFYGIAGVRTGVAWTKNRGIRQRLRGMQDTWPLSLPEVKVAVAALDSEGWASEARAALLADANSLEGFLQENFDFLEANVHYRFFFCSGAELVQREFLKHGIVIRAFGASHGVDPGGIRLAAPKASEGDEFASALEQIKASSTG
jgi:histidinol-phosphate aminotransferase